MEKSSFSSREKYLTEGPPNSASEGSLSNKRPRNSSQEQTNDSELCPSCCISALSAPIPSFKLHCCCKRLICAACFGKLSADRGCAPHLHCLACKEKEGIATKYEIMSYQNGIAVSSLCEIKGPDAKLDPVRYHDEHRIHNRFATLSLACRDEEGKLVAHSTELNAQAPNELLAEAENEFQQTFSKLHSWLVAADEDGLKSVDEFDPLKYPSTRQQSELTCQDWSLLHLAIHALAYAEPLEKQVANIEKDKKKIPHKRLAWRKPVLK